MAHPYKTYSIPQLQEEEELLKERLAQAIQDDRKSHIAVNRRKIEVVRSFMLDPTDFQPGDIYELIEHPHHLFEVDEISGVFAWGFKINKFTEVRHEKKDGFLLVMLGEKVEMK